MTRLKKRSRRSTAGASGVMSGRWAAPLAVLALMAGTSVLAQTPQSEDIVLKALSDELNRSMAGLKLADHKPPYFNSYTLKDTQSIRIAASYGAIDTNEQYHSRDIDTDLRVGDYKLDNSYAMRRGLSSIFRSFSGFPTEDNYDAIRQATWLVTDGAYKRAIEELQSKKALLQTTRVNDLPDSFAKVKPVVKLEPPVNLKTDDKKWEGLVRKLSSILAQSPESLSSKADFTHRAQTRWFISSEGSINREGSDGAIVSLSASAQTQDGMKVSDFSLFAADTEEQLPSASELEQEARSLSQRVQDLSRAPKLDEYSGPVLFEGQAAAEVFAFALAPKLVNPIPVLGMSSIKPGFADKLGRKVLAPFLTIVDDPLISEFKGKPLKGGYTIDEQGVPAQKLTLIENGVLKTLCSGRIPSRQIKESNGHWRSGASCPSRLIISSSKRLTPAQLKAKLIDIGKENGLKHVLIVRRMGGAVSGRMFINPLSLLGGDTSLPSPSVVYKVSVDDGTEELVRNVTFAATTQRFWRDIEATGDDDQAYPVLIPVGHNNTTTSLVTPSFIAQELETRPHGHESEKAMFLKKPTAKD